MQRETEKSALLHALVDRDHVRAEIQEKLLGALSILVKQMNHAALLREKQARAVWDGRQHHWRAQSLGDQFQADV